MAFGGAVSEGKLRAGVFVGYGLVREPNPWCWMEEHISAHVLQTCRWVRAMCVSFGGSPFGINRNASVTKNAVSTVLWPRAPVPPCQSCSSRECERRNLDGP